MANDFLISKWKIWYDSLDVNHDGTISIADVEESRKKFSEEHKLDAAKAKSVSDNFGKWWNTYIFHNKEGDVSESDFVAMLSKQFTDNKDKFLKDMGDCFDMFFDVIDTNKDRSISDEEFLFAFRAFGHEYVAEDNSFFQAYNPSDGLVPLRQVVDSWIDFVTSTDASKGSIVKTAFEAKKK